MKQGEIKHDRIPQRGSMQMELSKLLLEERQSMVAAIDVENLT